MEVSGMAIMGRVNTDYAGVYYIVGEGARGPERIYYIRYRSGGKLIEEKAGRQYQDDMTPARASEMRSRRIDRKETPNKEKRAKAHQAKEEEAGKWTIKRLWKAYQEGKPDMKGIKNDGYRYDKHLKESFGDKEPGDILQMNVDRLRITLGKIRKPQTVKHVLNLLDRIVNYGVKKGHIAQGLRFKIQKPMVQNIKTEDLSDDQIRGLLKAIENDDNIQVGAMLKLALFTGMRRGEIFKLRRDDLDFRRNLITIRDPKGGKDAIIPMNAQAKELLEKHPEGKGALVFPTDDGEQRKTVQNQVRRIREAAELPKDFRPFHGLRHVFASMMATSGQVDMYLLQRLLTHKSPQMTQRYAALRNEALNRAAAVAGDLIGAVMKPSTENVVELKKEK
jgi:integrase